MILCPLHLPETGECSAQIFIVRHKLVQFQQAKLTKVSVPQWLGPHGIFLRFVHTICQFVNYNSGFLTVELVLIGFSALVDCDSLYYTAVLFNMVEVGGKQQFSLWTYFSYRYNRVVYFSVCSMFSFRMQWWILNFWHTGLEIKSLEKWIFYWWV